MKVTRQQKIDYLVEWYDVELCKIDCDLNPDNDVKVLNQIIIDAVGVSGLTKVKETSWKKRKYGGN